MTDAAGKVYKAVKIGKQFWMAKNLNYKTGNSWCYDDDPANCRIYGRLYDWYTAMVACPDGWHLPSDDEWRELIDYLGGHSLAGGAMRDRSSLWSPPDKGSDYRRPASLNLGIGRSSGFSGLPGGGRFSGRFRDYGYLYDLGYCAYFWSSTEVNSDLAWYRELSHNDDVVGRSVDYKEFGFSCRCVRD